MKIWEYMQLEVRGWPNAGAEMAYVDATKSTVGRNNLFRALNALGGKGWEAIQMESQPQTGVTKVYLKRAKS